MAKRNIWLLFIFLLGSLLLPARTSAQQPSIAITVDDLPGVATARGPEGTAELADINRKLLAGFRRHHVPATGFVNEQKVEVDSEKRTAILETWLDAGMTLGNHTYSHPKFANITLEEFEKNTVDGERTIAPLLAKHTQKLRFFRYPFNDTGGTAEKKTAFERFLRERHYEIATCTVENSDWMFDRIYSDALRRGDTKHAEEIRSAYLDFTSKALDGYRKMAREVIGRDFPQVMLLHADHLNADSIDLLLAIFEKRGLKFVSLAQAQADLAYRTTDGYTGPYGWMWQQRWAKTLGVKVDPRDAPDPPQWVIDEADKLSKTGH